MQMNSENWAETNHFIPDYFARSGGLWPVRMGCNTVKRKYQVGPKSIDCYNLHFVMDGELEFTYEDGQVVLTKGDVFCMYPGATYRYKIIPTDVSLQIRWISFDGAQAPQLLDMARFSPTSPYLTKIINKDMEITLHHLFIKKTKEVNGNLFIYACLYQLFNQMLEQHVPDESPQGTDHLLNRSIEYMNTHFMDNITVQDAADYVSFHRVYFSKLFTKHTGVTPIQYLQKLRMDKAVQLLSHTSHSITEISLTLGYSDVYTFTRAFSKYYSYPPSTLRK